MRSAGFSLGSIVVKIVIYACVGRVAGKGVTRTVIRVHTPQFDAVSIQGKRSLLWILTMRISVSGENGTRS